MMQLHFLLIELPATLHAASMILLPQAMLYTQQLLSIVTVDVVTLAPSLHAARCHIDVDGTDTDTFKDLHS